jgi:hypothetical protein
MTEEWSSPSPVRLAFSAHYCGFEANIFRSRRVLSAASANSQSRNVAIFGFIAAAGGRNNNGRWHGRHSR